MNRLEYVPVWIRGVMGRIYGIMGHRSMIKNGSQLYPYYVVLALSAALSLVYFRYCHMHGHALAVAFIFLFYALVLMQLVNYESYYTSGLFAKALQGRYLFPVLAPFYALLTCGLMCSPHRRLRWIVALLVGGIFVYGGLPFFLHNVDSRWLM